MDSPEIERLRAALLTIREQYDHVCEEFDACNHPACRESYSPGHDATEALRARGEVERLRAENAALRRWLRLAVHAWRSQRGTSHALVSALRGLLADPYGCPMCDAGTLRNPEKAHWPECPYAIARAVLGE